MAPALVGTAGAVSLGSTDVAVTPSWGSGENRTAGNILICLCVGIGANTYTTVPTGWTAAGGGALTTSSFVSFLLVRTATGGDSAPTFPAVSSIAWAAQVMEWTGIRAAWDNFSTGYVSGTSSPQYGNTSADDTAPGELYVVAGAALYSTASTKTTSHSLNNGTLTTQSNDGTSTTTHYNFGYGVTTSNSTADQDTFTVTTTKLSAVVNPGGAILLPVVAATNPSSRRHRSPLHNVRKVPQRGRFMVAFPKLWTPSLWLPETA
jgi:hypothetical protein